MEDPKRGEEFDRIHKQPKFGKNHPGAKELASQYTTGRFNPKSYFYAMVYNVNISFSVR